MSFVRIWSGDRGYVTKHAVADLRTMLAASRHPQSFDHYCSIVASAAKFDVDALIAAKVRRRRDS